MKKIAKYAAAALVALAASSSTAMACSSCGCTLSPEWVAEGYTPRPGVRLDMRYDFLHQGDLRSGAHSVSKGSFALPNAEEVQRDTRTSIYTLGVDYTAERDWGLRIDVPMLDRFHTTVAPGDVAVSASDRAGIGDIKITSRYYGFGDRMTGFQLGLKLPTGAFRQDFKSGPQAGLPLDRGLQLGTGTTDAIFGIYNLGYLSKHLSRFEQVLVKTPLNSRADFRPGTAVNINAGVQYLGLPTFTPQFQLNAKIEARDAGAEADIPNSGSRVLYASPGVTARIAPHAQAYAFVQAPLYQDYNGLQLAPRMTVSAGLVYSF